MKKIFIAVTLLALIIFTGCSEEKQESKKKEPEKKEVVKLTPAEYYTIALDTIASEKEGIFNGRHQDGGIPSSIINVTYNGTLKQKNLSISGVVAAEGGDVPFELNNAIDSLNNATYETLHDKGILDIYNIDTSKCTIEDLIMNCVIEEVNEVFSTPYNENFYDTRVTGERTTFIFEFDDKNELKKIEIKYIGVYDMVKLTKAPENNVLDVVYEYFDSSNPEKFFDDESHLINGGIYNGVETLEY